MNVIFIVPRLDKASTRYRVLQYLPYLEKKGITVEVEELPKGGWQRWCLWKRCADFDRAFLQKRLLSAWDFYWLRRFSKILFYDFDDAVMLPDSNRKESRSYAKERKFSRIVKGADGVIAGNTYLREQAKKFGAKKIAVINTPIDLHRYEYPQSAKEKKDELTIGWIGSRGTLQYLELIRPALEDIGAQYPNVKLKIIADEFLQFRNIEVEPVDWSLEEEVAQLRSLDIGIMPLTDDPWSRGKCGFKLLQYMGVGIATVCHPVGLNKEIVVHGETGYWADNNEDWLQALKLLIENPSLREKMGEKGRQRLEQCFDLAGNAKTIIELLLMPDVQH